MKLYEKWQNLTNMSKTNEEANSFWNDYFKVETDIYRKILKNNRRSIKGKVSDIAKSFEVPEVVFTGFLDGINDSLVEKIDINNIVEESDISIDIDYEKLYYNMHNAKAKWLYDLNEWDNILSKKERAIIREKYLDENTVRNTNKIGRNEPCPCGSGKKYKKCCINKN